MRASLLLSITFGLACVSGAFAQMSEMPPSTLYDYKIATPPEWVYTHLRRAHMGPMSMDEVDVALASGANLVSVEANALVWHSGEFKGDAPADGEATIRKYIDRVHAGGAKAMMYLAPFHRPQLDPKFKDAHPDWFFKTADGRVIDGQISFMTPFSDKLCDQFKWLGSLGLDGIWLDGFYPIGVSYDDSSRARYRAERGKEIPSPITWDSPDARDYAKWYRQKFLDLSTRLRDSLRSGNADAAIFMNYHALHEIPEPRAWILDYPYEYPFTLDGPSLELYWYNHGDVLYPSFNIWALYTLLHGHPAMAWPTLYAYNSFGRMTEAELLTRYLTPIANGMGTEFVTPTGNPKDFKTVFEATRQREEWMTHTQPIRWGALIADRNSKEFYSHPSPLQLYLESIWGAFKVSAEEHLQLNFVSEIDLENNDLDGYKFIIAPNAACLSDRALYNIRGFVEKGGGFVASGVTSLYNPDGTKRNNFALNDLLGVDDKATLVHTQLMDAEKGPVDVHIEESQLHPIMNDPIIRDQMFNWVATPPTHPFHHRLQCPAMIEDVTTRSNAKVLAKWYKENTFDDPKPAVIESIYGKGKVIYFPVSIDQMYYTFNAPWARRMFVNAMNYVASEPFPFQISGPLCLRTTFVMQPDKNRLIVHLLNNGGSFGQHSLSAGGDRLRTLYKEGEPHALSQREEIIPLTDIGITSQWKRIKRAYLQPEGTKLKVRRKGGSSSVLVPKLDIHSMVVFELEDSAKIGKEK